MEQSPLLIVDPTWPDRPSLSGGFYDTLQQAGFVVSTLAAPGPAERQGHVLCFVRPSPDALRPLLAEALPVVEVLTAGSTAPAVDAALGVAVVHDPPAPAELTLLRWMARAAKTQAARQQGRQEAEHGNLAELGQLVGHIAHEIRNPLTALSAKIQWLKLKSAEPLVLVTSDALLVEVDRLSHLLNDVLELARAGPGRTTTLGKRANAEVKQTLAEVVDLYRETCENARVQLVVDINEQSAAPARVAFPAAELHRVFQNLLTNAIDATPPDETIHIKVAPDSTNMLRVEFRNPGHLAEDTISHAFDMFFTTKPNGTGLGLPIVKRLLTTLAGDIHVRNEGDSVVIAVLLPLVA